MSNYQNSVIYKIECNDTKIKECYIGSTGDFMKRRYKHKYSCNTSHRKEYNLKVYLFIRENGGWKNWTMKIIINYPCNSKNELIIKEQEILKTYDNTLNCISAYASIEDRKIQFKKKARKYYIENAEKIKEHRAEKIQCKCGRLISRCNISTHRKNPTHKLPLGIV